MSGPEREQEPTGEDASATVELAVLLPVYLLLTFALLTIGELVLVRQGTVLAARYRAWLPGKALGDSTVTRSFFGKLAARGSFLSSDAATTDVTWSEADLALDGTARARTPGPDPESAVARKLALAVLGDSANGPHLQ